MQIIPAIDIFQGMCVRLVEGDFSSRREYNVSPREKAEEFASAGATRIHVVDLEGAKAGSIVNRAALSDLLSIGGLTVQVGGGVRSAADIEFLINLGAANVVVGSVAVSAPETMLGWIDAFGPERFCVALDVRDGVLATHGWQSDDPADLDAVIGRLLASGIVDILSTDIRRDGMLAGPNLGMYAGLVSRYPEIRWIASGGVSSMSDIAALRETGVWGTVVGKALYEHRIRLSELFNR